MVLVLAIGDLHVPFRAAGLPPQFRELLVPGKVQCVLCTIFWMVMQVQRRLGRVQRALCSSSKGVRLKVHRQQKTEVVSAAVRSM